MTSLHEIPGVSGWALIAPLVGLIPDEMMKEAGKCESPIEQLLTAALALAIEAVPIETRPSLETQVTIGRYRADIVVTSHNGKTKIVVECDGKEFHKDKAKDAARTHEIEKRGYHVFRLTGSEIHHNPLAEARLLLARTGLAPMTLRQAHHLIVMAG